MVDEWVLLLVLETVLKKDKMMEKSSVVYSVLHSASQQDQYLVEQMVVILAA